MLRVEDLAVRYGATIALAGVSLAVPDGAITAIIGPSGSGKTSLLRGVAGLEPLASGRVTWDEEDLTDRPPHRRDFGLMFQDHALFDHLDVAANVRFGLRMRGRSTTEQRTRADEVLDLVGLGGFGGRRVDALSGGEQQRVAMARALANSPKLLLADEPTGNLDPETSNSVFEMLTDLVRSTGIGAMIATHNMDLAERMDRILELKAGRIISY